MKRYILVCALGFTTLFGQIPAGLRSSLLFHAPFDGGPDAEQARGDRRIYSAPNYKTLDEAKPGLGKIDAEIAAKRGVRGDAIRFRSVNSGALFFKAPGNVAYKPDGWSGTVSFWLSLNPDKDLKGFSDPIQITDKAYNDAALWVDFTKDERPRHFRLGVFGNLADWNPNNVAPDKNPDFLKRLIVLEKAPFSAGNWTHVAVTWSGLGGRNGTATLYVNARSIGTAEGIREPFTWDEEKGTIRVGVNYAGLMDELAVFDRPLDAGEVEQLHRALR